MMAERGMFCMCKKSKIGEVLPLLLCYTVPWTEDQLKAKAPWHENVIQAKVIELQVARRYMNTVTSKDGTKIAYDKQGEGPAVILVYGALCYRSFGSLPELVKLLAPHFTVYNYDRRGRGDSGDTRPYAVEREVEDLEALIKEAGGSAFVCGFSSGAALALEAASRRLAITKLALYEPPFIVDDSRPSLPEDFATQLAELVSSDRRGDAAELFMTKAAEVPVEVVAQMRHA